MSETKRKGRIESFARHFVEHMNAAAAARAAGYSPNGAHVAGNRMLRNAKVQAHIEELRLEALQKLDISRESVLKELAKVGFSSMADYTRKEGNTIVVDLSCCTHDQLAAIQELHQDAIGEPKVVRRTRLRLVPKTHALELLGKHLGLFPTHANLPAGGDYKPLGVKVEFVESDANGRAKKK